MSYLITHPPWCTRRPWSADFQRQTLAGEEETETEEEEEDEDGDDMRQDQDLEEVEEDDDEVCCGVCP